ncbi:hypothetical protein ACIQ9P_38615 [Kitasatospora sp. NPDC094019]|uniref:hypothetical protein n=1 Tax=Kitasatospora sp. NPDC094019 TaxID=3364091 RepID=UPI003829F6C1
MLQHTAARPGKLKAITPGWNEQPFGCPLGDGPFSSFALAFVRRLLDVDRYHCIKPEVLEFLEPEDPEAPTTTSNTTASPSAGGWYGRKPEPAS